MSVQSKEEENVTETVKKAERERKKSWIGRYWQNVRHTEREKYRL